MSEVIVKLPVKVLAEIVSCADGLGQAVGALENLNREWAVVERVRVDNTPDQESGHDRSDSALMTIPFETREELVAHLERSHTNPAVEVVAALKNGVPRNVRVKVQVQFR